MGFDWWRQNAETAEPGVRVQDIVDRVQAERRRERVQLDSRAADSGLWPTRWLHEAPECSMGVLEAQMTMQRHRECNVGECPRKTTAWRVLVEMGKIRPDAGRTG